MTNRLYHDPTGFFRNVALHVEPAAEKRYAEAEVESIEQILDTAVARGAITTDDRFDWRNRLRSQPELTEEILTALPGDREYGEQAARRDPRLVKLAHDWNSYLGVEDEVRAFADVGLTDSERQEREFARLTNQHLFA